jgi:hypothetical protein
MRNRRVIAVIGIVGIALLLAFPLRDDVFRLFIIPLAYVFWVLSLIYHAVRQTIWWALAMLVVLFLVSKSLLPQFKARKRVPLKAKPIVGQVESFATWIKKTEQGMYFKWLIANRLGKIANQILANRSTGRQRTFFDPLTGPDWTPDSAVRSYLESGLHGSFADYPQKSSFFSTPVQTPLDHDLSEVVQYLESQVEDATH